MTYALTEEQRVLRAEAREFARRRLAPLSDPVYFGERPAIDLFRVLADAGWIGCFYPVEYGGSGMSLITYAIIVEEICRVDPIAASFLALQALGSAPLIFGGSEEQKRRYLPKLASGEWLCCFGLTEPGAGSDNLAMTARAVRDGDSWVLNGTKRFISNADVAQICTVFAKTDATAGADGISAFLVETGSTGFQVPRTERKMSGHGINACDVVLEDCRVPASAMLGPEGQGFRIAMRGLARARSLVAARAVGLAQGAVDIAVSYAKERVTFGRPIAEHQGIQFMLADMATQTEAARHLTYRASTVLENEEPDARRLAAMCKLFATDVAMKVTTDAVQILGGYGFTMDYPAERRMKEAKLAQIIDGTNQIQRVLVARSLLAN